MFLDGALVGLRVQLSVVPLLQDPVELLREGVVKWRHALGVGLRQQHVAVPVHLPQDAGQSGRQPVGVVHVGERGRVGKRGSWRRRFGRGHLIIARNNLEEGVEGRHGDGATTLTAVAVAGDGSEFKMGAPLSLRLPQDPQTLLGELAALSGPSGTEAHVKQHHG